MFILEVTQELLHIQHLQQITLMKEAMNKTKLQTMIQHLPQHHLNQIKEIEEVMEAVVAVKLFAL